MKAPFSSYLDHILPPLKSIIDYLSSYYEYVSLLSTDSVGFTIGISKKKKTLQNENLTTERGTVIRVLKDGLYSEYAFNQINPEEPELTAKYAHLALEQQFQMLKHIRVPVFQTAACKDEPLDLLIEKETERLPENEDLGSLVSFLSDLSVKGQQTITNAIDCNVRAVSTHISKLFLSKERCLRQSYVYTEGSIAAFAPNQDGEIKTAYEGVSGLGGPEILAALQETITKMPKIMDDLLKAERVSPGEYEIITDPGISGLIAHEAFGHGVEMDMFVKERALGAQYLNKRVGSDLVTMHEGALCADSVASYAFDDEGTLAGDVTEIDHGILKTGICDLISALRLGIQPTGNGKRENYSHKVYTRMTNTLFECGNNTLEEMISSIKHGYLLSGTESGMEDPKHWGIQCIISRGYEIRNGEMTGKVVSPVIMTGYVPDLLGNITMAGSELRIDGNGACGKGYKEWVKVADGGPYLKTKARLG